MDICIHSDEVPSKELKDKKISNGFKDAEARYISLPKGNTAPAVTSEQEKQEGEPI